MTYCSEYLAMKQDGLVAQQQPTSYIITQNATQMTLSSLTGMFDVIDSWTSELTRPNK